MNILESISQIATSIGTIVAVLTLISGYNLYSQGKRDERTSRLRRFLGKMESSADTLDWLVGHEILNDMASSIIFSTQMKYSLMVLMEKLKQNDITSWGEDEFLKFTKENLPSITVPIKSEIALRYERELEEFKIALMGIKTDYPGVSLFAEVAFTVFSIVHFNSKRLLLDDELWEEIVASELMEWKGNCEISFLQHRLQVLLTAILVHKIKVAHDQEDINAMKELVEIVSSGYQNLSDQDLYRQLIKEHSLGLQGMNMKLFSSIPDGLYEAEKALKLVIGEDNVMKYHRIVAAFEERNKPNANH